MKHRIASLLTTALILSQPILFVGSVAAATNAVWKSVPGSGDWNTGTNWVSGAAPLFPGDTATFNTSSQLSVSLSSDVSVDTLTFNSGASAFTISVPATISFNFSGPGIVNNSGLTQTINNSGNLLFYGAATSAGTATLNNSGPGSGISFNNGTAGNATINNSGSGSYIEFRTTNGNATVTNSGPNSGVYFYFFNPVSGSAAFNNTNATAFLDCSGSATLVTVGSIAGIGNIFLGNGSKGLVVGTNDADTTFSGLLKDGGAFGGIGGTLTKVGNGTLTLSNANTYTGPTAINSGKLELTGSLLSAVTVSGGAFLDISGASSSAGVGSIAGAGSIFLGGKTLITGTDNTNTTFSGSIQDGGLFGGSGGNLTKVGGGTLILSGANTYTGSTAINAGRLAVNSSLGSGVSIAHGATLGGNGSINAAVTSKGEIAPGLSAGQLTINGDMQLRFPSDLSFEIGGTTPAGQYDVLNKIDNAGLKLNGNLGVTLINGFVPANTDTFTILTTTTPLTGHFNNVLNGTRVNTEDGGGSFIATYSGNNVALSDFGAPIPVSKLLNISTRADVETGDNVTIGGFIITGTAQKKVIIRGLGPSLSNFGLQNVLADPTLELHNAIGALITSNDNWKVNDQTQQSQSAEVSATGLPPSNDPESAIVMMLDPGNYTAILAGKNGGTGIGLIEVYDLTSAADSKLANISTRGLVGTGDNVLIGGIIIGPSSGTTKTVLVRALGPSLPNSIANRLLDPTLELHDGTGATIVSNDNWKINQQTDIEDTGLAPSNDNEAAILASLLPGNYTAIVHGAGNTSGVALVEVYDLENLCVPPPPNMVSWWPGDGNANDIQGGNNGTLQGGATFAGGEVGQAFSFTSNTDEVLVPHNSNQNTGAQITLDAWVLIPNPFGPSVVDAPEIIAKHTANMSDGYRFELINSPPRNAFNGLFIEITTTDGFFDIEVDNVITPGTWQHLAATYDGAAIRLFVNGVEVGNTPATGSLVPVTADLTIGGSNQSTSRIVDEVELFNRALSPTEIGSIYAAGSAGKCKP